MSVEAVPARKVTFLKSADLAERWGTTPQALANLRWRGKGPRFIKIPGVGIRYDLAVIEAYERSGDEE